MRSGISAALGLTLLVACSAIDFARAEDARQPCAVLAVDARAIASSYTTEV